MNTKGIKFLAVLAVLVMAFAAIAIIAPAEENDALPTENFTTAFEKATYDEATKTVKLTENVSSMSGTALITSGTDYILDLNGYNISATDMRVIWIQSGSLEIIGPGKICANHSDGNQTFQQSSSVIRVSQHAVENIAKASLVIGEDVTIESNWCYGVSIFGKNATQYLEINGTVRTTGEDAGALANNGTSTYSDTTIVISETGLVESVNGAATYFPGKGVCTINGMIAGQSGIEVKAMSYILGPDAIITATASERTHVENNNGTSTSGYAVAVVENTHYKTPVFELNGATILGDVALVNDNVIDGSMKGSIKINSGTVIGNVVTVPTNDKIVNENGNVKNRETPIGTHQPNGTIEVVSGKFTDSNVTKYKTGTGTIEIITNKEYSSESELEQDLKQSDVVYAKDIPATTTIPAGTTLVLTESIDEAKTVNLGTDASITALSLSSTDLTVVNGANQVALSGFNGSYVEIMAGSVIIAGTDMSGTIAAKGDIVLFGTLGGDLKLTVASDAGITLDARLLVTNGHSVIINKTAAASDSFVYQLVDGTYSDFTTGSDVTIADLTEVISVLEHKVVTVSFNALGGSAVTDVTIDSGSDLETFDITTYTSTLTGYELQGWATSYGGTALTSAWKPTAATQTVYALWAKTTEKDVDDMKYIDETEVTPTNADHEYYYSDDASVKVKGYSDVTATFYVQNGKSLQLNFERGGTFTNAKVEIYTVTGDVDAKNIRADTAVTFNVTAGQVFYYTAATFKYTSVDTDPLTAAVSTNAMISADNTLTFVTKDLAFGKKVSVASGQTVITTTKLDDYLTYGVRVLVNGTYTYYGVGDTADTISLNGMNDVIVKNGTVDIENTASGYEGAVKFSGVKSDAGMKITIAGNILKITGTEKSGTITISGKVNAAFTAKGTVVVASKATVTGSIASSYGTVSIRTENPVTVTGNGTVKAENTKLWNTDQTAVQGLDDFTGLIDTTAISKVAKMSDDITTSTVAVNQTIELIGNTTVSKALSVYGILIVDEGVTLTITEGATVSEFNQYAQIINNGTIIVKTDTLAYGMWIYSGKFVNNGTINAESKAPSSGTLKAAVAITEYADATNNGTISISRNDYTALNLFNTGTININGYIGDYHDVPTYIKNAGTVNFTNAIMANSDVVIDLQSKGAKLEVTSVTIGKTDGDFHSLIVLNTGISGKNASGSTVYGTTVAGITALNEPSSSTITVRGISFTGGNSAGTDTIPMIDIAGVLNVAGPANPSAAFVQLDLAGRTYITGNLSIPDYVMLNTYGLSNDVELVVEGNLTISSKAAELTSTDTTMIVTGKITDAVGLLDGNTYVAAKYTLANGTEIYTTLANAISEAQAAEIAYIDIGGTSSQNVVVDSDLTIPTGMVITGNYMTIDDGAEITVTTNGKLAVTNVDVADGMLYAPSASDISSTVTADVKVEGTNDILYSSLLVALENATAGTVIELNQDVTLWKETLTIPEGIILDATDGSLNLVQSNMVVDGTFYKGTFTFKSQYDDEIGITVDGLMLSTTAYGNAWYVPVGVVFKDTLLDLDGNETEFYCITSIENLQAAILASDDGKVTVQGEAKIGDITVAGSEAQVAQVTFQEDLIAGTISLSNAVIVLTNGKTVTAEFEDLVGSITIKNAVVGANTKVSSTDAGVVLSGTLLDSTDGTYSVLFEGITGMNNAKLNWGYYDDSDNKMIAYPVIVFDGTTVASGKTNEITGINTGVDHTKDYDIILVSGSLVAGAAAKIDINSDVNVLGTVAGVEKTATTAAGNVNINKNVFVGTLRDVIFDGDAAVKAHNSVPGATKKTYVNYGKDYNTAADALITGNVAISGFITVLDGSTVSETVIDDKEPYYISIDGDLWLTVYGKGTYYLNGLVPPIVDADVKAIVDIEGNVIAQYSSNYGVIYDSVVQNFGIDLGVDIELVYDIYTVEVKTDGSIKAVYIDGYLMTTRYSANVFAATNIEAGSHIIKVEPVAGYTADNAYLYLDDGTKLVGMTFIFDGEDVDDYLTIALNVAGTEPIPEPEPVTPEEKSEWTITTILLCVLVVLIAIMAVIVALRLNRN